MDALVPSYSYYTDACHSYRSKFKLPLEISFTKAHSATGTWSEMSN